jgi:pre-rRNA-processing protein IPI1
MRDLLTKYPHLLDLQLAEICERVVECVVDLERGVRQALLTFLAGLFPLVSEEVIAPFFPIFIVYMTSALTHMKQSIRVDALGFINIWIKHFPALVAAEHVKVRAPLPVNTVILLLF